MQNIVGVVGLGIMGGAFAKNLREAGFAVVGCDVSEKAQAALKERGGTVVATPREVAERTPVIILSLPTVKAVDDVVSGPNGLVHSHAKGRVMIEMGTMPLDVKQRAHDALQAAGHTLLDCPVSGTGAQAWNKDLVVLASGDEAAYKKCLYVFEGMSRRICYLGPFGNGSKMKFIANHLVTIHNVAAGEAIALGIKSGLDPQLVFDTLSDSAGSSRMFQVRGPLMVEDAYDKVTATHKTHTKDLEIIKAFADGLAMPTPLFAAASQYYYAAIAQGLGNLDTASVCKVSENLGGVARNKKGK